MEENKPLETQPSAQSPNKMDENKIMAILSYLSILCLIPLFTKKDNEFVYYHAKQGLVLFGFETFAYKFVSILCTVWVVWYNRHYFYGFESFLSCFVNLRDSECYSE